MSPLVIAALVVAVLVLLIAIGYINHMVENSKLEKARLKADLNDRVRRSRDVSENMPGQLMTPALKLLLSRLSYSSATACCPPDKQNPPQVTVLPNCARWSSRTRTSPYATRHSPS